MSREVRSRVLLGVGIPLLAFLFLAGLIFAFSRILLAVPESLAPWIALLFAINILVGAALAAMVRGTRGFAFLIVVLVGTIVGGGVVGAVAGEREIHSLVAEGEGGEEEPQTGEPAGAATPSPPAATASPPEEGGEDGAEGGAVTVAAENISFDTTELTLPAEGQVTIEFENRDPVPHNVAIYTEQGGEPIFQGEIFSGPDTMTYEFPAPDPGTYYFQCDVHPQMNGTVTVG